MSPWIFDQALGGPVTSTALLVHADGWDMYYDRASVRPDVGSWNPNQDSNMLIKEPEKNWASDYLEPINSLGEDDDGKMMKKLDAVVRENDANANDNLNAKAAAHNLDNSDDDGDEDMLVVDDQMDWAV